MSHLKINYRTRLTCKVKRLTVISSVPSGVQQLRTKLCPNSCIRIHPLFRISLGLNKNISDSDHTD